MLPYVLGYASESIQQVELYQYHQVNISSIDIQLERSTTSFWMFAFDYKDAFEDATTLLLSRPYVHDKYQPIQFNKLITTADFTNSYQIFSDQFMQCYHLIRAPFIRQFMELPGTEKFLSVRKGKVYCWLPKKQIQYRVELLDELEDAVQDEAATAVKIALHFQQMFQL